jgi:hypothetical protein
LRSPLSKAPRTCRSYGSVFRIGITQVQIVPRRFAAGNNGLDSNESARITAAVGLGSGILARATYGTKVASCLTISASSVLLNTPLRGTIWSGKVKLACRGRSRSAAHGTSA